MKIQAIFPSFTLLMALILITIEQHTDKTLVVAQGKDAIFEFPVQLVGFPVIIMAVRLSNFVKKLAYSVNPKTYQPRAKRSSPFHAHRRPHLVSSSSSSSSSSRSSNSDEPVVRSAIDTEMAEKKILEELGPKACVLEEPCKVHALRPGKAGEQPDWNDILSNYKVQRNGMKQWYLLSVFLGDVIRDASLCKRLAKRIPCSQNISKAHVKQ